MRKKLERYPRNHILYRHCLLEVESCVNIAAAPVLLVEHPASATQHHSFTEFYKVRWDACLVRDHVFLAIIRNYNGHYCGSLVYNQYLSKKACNTLDELDHPFILGLARWGHCKLNDWPNWEQPHKVFNIEAVYLVSVLHFFEQLVDFVMDEAILLVIGVIVGLHCFKLRWLV